MEFAQSYLKGYVLTWWRIVKQNEGKTHGYTWKFFEEHIELEFIINNYNYISRCKLSDLVNSTNDNLRQCVKAYTKCYNPNLGFITKAKACKGVGQECRKV
jgi:hypothetical protein